MPKCVVKGCKNHSSKNQKQDGITFHTFPNGDQNIKEKWVAIIRDSRKEPSWQPTGHSVVCSTHFHNDDLYHTKKGYRRVRKNGYPKILPNVNEGLDIVDLSQAPNVQEQPAAPDLSNNLNPTQPFSCAILPHIEGLDYMDLSQPTNVQEPSAAPNILNYFNLSQDSSLCAIQAVKSDSPVFDTPRKHKLRRRVLLLEKKLKKNKSKINSLRQKVRRLHKRNKSLTEILDNLKKANYIDTDLFNTLNGNITSDATDLCFCFRKCGSSARFSTSVSASVSATFITEI